MPCRFRPWRGGNHFLPVARRNIGLVDLIENNHVYSGLTKGQYSPTSRLGFITKTSPAGAPLGVRPLEEYCELVRESL